MTDHEWRDIPGFPDYQINEQDDIRDGEGEDVRARVTPDGVMQVSLWVDGVRSNHYVAYLHALAFPERYSDEAQQDFEDDKAKLYSAFKDVLDKKNVDYYGLHDQIATALVERAVTEGWRPEGYEQ